MKTKNKKKKKQTISACIVIRNEERFIKRCIKSFKDIVDEIIIVHSGKCTDNTLKICKQYTNKIYIAPDYGVADPNRALSFSKATKDWILRIDGDEYLSSELKKSIPALVSDEKTDGYAAKWDFYNYGGKSLYEYKPFLMRRKKMLQYKGNIHEAIQTKGKVENLDLKIIHTPPSSPYTWASFKRKGKWAKLQASQLKNKKNFIVYLINAPLVAVFYFFYMFFKYFNLRVSFFTAAYNFLVNWHAFMIQAKLEKPAEGKA